MIFEICAIAGIIFTVCYFFILHQKCVLTLIGKHVLITGGSSGIGLEVAIDVVSRGGKVTLVARDIKKLNDAKEQITKAMNIAIEKEDVQVFSLDVKDKANISSTINASEDTFGPIYMLVNCAGCASPGKFEDLSEEDIRNTLDINLLGSIFVTQEVVRRMKEKERSGIIVLTSSLAGYFGFFGFSIYSAAKGALIRFAEALHMELKPFNISVTVSLPPDTDTPGLKTENERKPEETRLISESAGLFQADKVAENLVEDALQGKFFSIVGFEGFMLRTVCAGMSPVTDIPSFLQQIFLAGPLRFITWFYLMSYNRIVASEAEKRKKIN